MQILLRASLFGVGLWLGTSVSGWAETTNYLEPKISLMRLDQEHLGAIAALGIQVKQCDQGRDDLRTLEIDIFKDLRIRVPELKKLKLPGDVQIVSIQEFDHYQYEDPLVTSSKVIMSQYDASKTELLQGVGRENSTKIIDKIKRAIENSDSEKAQKYLSDVENQQKASPTDYNKRRLGFAKACYAAKLLHQIENLRLKALQCDASKVSALTEMSYRITAVRQVGTRLNKTNDSIELGISADNVDLMNPKPLGFDVKETPTGTLLSPVRFAQ